MIKKAIIIKGWEKLRKEALRNANHKCSVCGKKKHLHAHHMHYPARNLSEILILCPNCHFEVHGKNWGRQGYIQWSKKRLQELVYDNKSLREMSKLLQVSHERIRQKLKEFGIEKTKTNYELPIRTKQLKSRIIQFRQIKQLTQIELAKRIGCSYASIARYERGKAMPSKIYLLRLCAVFYCQPGELFLCE